MSAVAQARRRLNAAQQEHQNRERQLEFLDHNFKVGCAVSFEHRTDSKIKRQLLLSRTRSLAEADSLTLQNRRELIRTLYQSEYEEWKLLLEKAQTVTPQQRMEQTRQRALLLQQKRETERLQFVKQCEERRWRDSCHDIRVLDSLALEEQVLKDRKAAFLQISAKKVDNLRVTNSKEESALNLAKLQQHEKEEREARLREKTDLKAALDTQVQCLQLQTAAQQEQRRLEQKQEAEAWKTKAANKREEEMAAIREACEMRDDVVRANMARLEARKRLKEAETLNDSILLQYALEKEQRDIQQELAQKEQGKEISQEYLLFLNEQKIKDYEDIRCLENIHKTEAEKIWVQKDNMLKAQQEARRTLILDVGEARREQMRQKERQVEIDQKELASHIAEKRVEWAQQAQAEQNEVVRHKENNRQNMIANKTTIDLKWDDRATERQEKHLTRKQIEYADRQYQDRIANEITNVPSYSLRHTKL